MSRINAETLSNLAGTSTGDVTRINRGHAKMWAILGVDAGVPSIANSQNLSSVLDLDVGLIGLNLTTSMSSANWALSALMQNTGSAVSTASLNRVFSRASNAAQVYSFDTASTPRDPVNYQFSLHGDLA